MDFSYAGAWSIRKSYFHQLTAKLQDYECSDYGVSVKLSYGPEYSPYSYLETGGCNDGRYMHLHWPCHPPCTSASLMVSGLVEHGLSTTNCRRNVDDRIAVFITRTRVL